MILPLLVFMGSASAQSWEKYVQPLSGTAPSTTASARKHSEAGSEQRANTIPSVGRPFGMTQWVAQTRGGEAKCIPPYIYTDSVWYGFRGTHWISGSCMQDYGSVTIGAVTGSLQHAIENPGMRFSHRDEIASPSYYSLKTGTYLAELTATRRCGVIRFTMLQSDSIYLLVSPNSDAGKGYIQVDPEEGDLWGYNPVHRIYQGWGLPAGFNGWFYAKIRRPITVSGTYEGKNISSADRIKARDHMGAYIGFWLKAGESVEIYVGTSFSSLAGASRNLEMEIGDMDFAQVRKSAESDWQHSLSSIEIETRSDVQKNIFYTSLYHALQQPRLYNDVDGNYPKFSGNYELANTDSRDYYDDFSMWDIYRAQLPLVSLLDSARAWDLVQSQLRKGQQGKWLPVFPCWNNYTSAMIGDHVIAFVASAYMKGIRPYDINEIYRLMRKNAFETADKPAYKDGMGRRSLGSYLTYGYIPLEDSVPFAYHKKEQVSRTLEYAYDDYALAMIAKDLGLARDFGELRNRAFNYRNVYDSMKRTVNGRYSNGNWFPLGSKDQRISFITEGTPRQYMFYVPQDVPGLARMMGGRAGLERELDSLFSKDEYWHGNEPGHQIPFMYNYTSAPWKTQRVVRRILEEEYGDGPGGLSGNDDAGQMSAWYIFAAMGFYPLDPVSGNYLISSPLFDRIRIRLPAGNYFEIRAHRKSENDLYIARVQLNGHSLTGNYIHHTDLTNGGLLEVWLQAKPSGWGSEPDNQPPGLASIW